MIEKAQEVAKQLDLKNPLVQPTGFCGSQGIVFAPCNNDTVFVLSTKEDLERMVAACELALFALQRIEMQRQSSKPMSKEEI